MHRPFEVLAEWIGDRGLPPDRGRAPGAPEPRPPEIPAGGAPSPAGGARSDAELFREAVGPVRPVSPAGGVRIAVRSEPARGRRDAGGDDGADGVRILRDLCRRGHIGLRARREYVEEWIAPLGRLYIDDLRAGRFAIQAHLDLHGLGLDTARRELDAFIRESVKAGHRAVRVIHGRGRHSPGGRPLMKQNVERWLRQRRMSRYVLAYTSAREVDGGGGAVYVLLRGS